MSYLTQDRIDEVRSFTMRRIRSFENGIKKGTSDTARHLAALRHGLGHAPGSYPEAWQVAFDGCPEELLGRGETPSLEETAIYITLTDFAMHMQGAKQTMNDKDMPLGSAMRRLAMDAQGEASSVEMPRSFAALVTAGSVEEMEYHLRQSLSRLRQKRIGVSYAKLISQVLRFQDDFRRDGVRLEWSREFAHLPKRKDAPASENPVVP